MIRGIISGVMAMRAQVANQEIIANNLANSATVAFNRDTSVFRSFHDVLMYRMQPSSATAIGPFTGGTVIQDVCTIHTVGPIETTGNPLDVALSGGTFLAVETPAGERYTRRGDMEIDRQGFLTVGGFRVLGEAGPIKIQDPSAIAIDEDGTVTSGGEEAGVLRLVSFSDVSLLTKEGTSLFKASESAQTSSETGTVQQGALEKSSVDPVSEMVKLIHTMRAYEAAQKAIKSHDEALNHAINKVGRVQ